MQLKYGIVIASLMALTGLFFTTVSYKFGFSQYTLNGWDTINLLSARSAPGNLKSVAFFLGLGYVSAAASMALVLMSHNHLIVRSITTVTVIAFAIALAMLTEHMKVELGGFASMLGALIAVSIAWIASPSQLGIAAE